MFKGTCNEERKLLWSGRPSVDCWRLPRAFVWDSDLHILFIPGSCPAEQKGISYSLAFFAHFSLWFSRLNLDCVRSVFLVSQNDLSREFQRSSLSRDLPRGSILLFAGRLPHLQMRKQWVSLEATARGMWLLELPLLKRINGVCRFVEFSWKLAECSSDINTQNSLTL